MIILLAGASHTGKTALSQKMPERYRYTAPSWTVGALSPDDALVAARMFRQTVHAVAARDYSPAQLEAWAPHDEQHQRTLAKRLAAQVSVGVKECGILIGFGTLSDADAGEEAAFAESGGSDAGPGDAAMQAARAANAEAPAAAANAGASAVAAKSGELDMLYVHKDRQRQGIATRIADELEHLARQRGWRTIRTFASKTARPFFARRGYRILHRNIVVRQGVELENYVMEKALER